MKLTATWLPYKCHLMAKIKKLPSVAICVAKAVARLPHDRHCHAVSLGKIGGKILNPHVWSIFIRVVDQYLSTMWINCRSQVKINFSLGTAKMQFLHVAC
jgi:hypothetical protein